jgi:hypothetical protein
MCSLAKINRMGKCLKCKVGEIKRISVKYLKPGEVEYVQQCDNCGCSFSGFSRLYTPIKKIIDGAACHYCASGKLKGFDIPPQPGEDTYYKKVYVCAVCGKKHYNKNDLELRVVQESLF